jgi:hypothetical protein
MSTNETTHHDLGITGNYDTLTCDCGKTCADLDAWHTHTVRTYNHPDELAIQCRGNRVHTIVKVDVDPDATVTPCRKIACCNHGNGRECWTVTLTNGVHLYEFTNVDAARHLVSRGGVVSETYLYSHC